MTNPLPHKADMVIIGGGLMGTSIAWQTAKRGVSNILLLEQGTMGAQGATYRSLGGWRTLFGTEINILFSLHSKPIFDGMKAELDIDPAWVNIGYLYTASSDKGWSVLENTAEINEKLKVPAEIMTPQRVAEKWPYLRTDDVHGGLWNPAAGIYGPQEVLQGFARGARRHGVTIREDTKVTGILTNKGRVIGVETQDGQRIKSDLVINASGPWAGQVAALAGLDLPIGPLRRHLFHTAPFPFEYMPRLTPFTLHFESGWYFRREGDGVLLSGPADNKPEQHSFSEKVDFDAEEWTALKAMERIPIMEKARIARGWVGHYAISPDHHHVIGEFPEMKSLIHVSGFSGHGFQQSAAVGVVVAELITKGRAETIDIERLRPTRFREGQTIHEALTSFRD